MIHTPFDTTLHLELIDSQHNLRFAAEQYVADRYQQAFDAHIKTFMPNFLALMKNGEIRSLCGFREAGMERLFLEQYLDEPIECLATQALGVVVFRHQLIEFGQLASFSKGMSPIHFYLMARHLVGLGYRWCVCTVTDTLHALFNRLQLEPVAFANASSERIDKAQQWGNYYHHSPRIIVGDLAQSLARLESCFTVEVHRSGGIQ